MPDSPRVSLVIPTLRGRVERLLASVREQTLPPADVQVVEGIRPSGRARNLGAARAGGDVLVFVDDDAVLGDPGVIARLVAPFSAPGSENLAVTGASKVLPSDASWFQRWAAREIPRITHPVVASDLESNPATDAYGFSDVTTTCCAIRRSVWDEVGRFHEGLFRGVDTEFFFRVRRAGYRFLLVGNTWVNHPAPADPVTLLSKFFEMGVWHSQEALLNPERRIGVALPTPLHAIGYLLLRTAILVPNVFVPWSFAYRKWELSVKPLKALASYAAAFGYAYGATFRRPPSRNGHAGDNGAVGGNGAAH